MSVSGGCAEVMSPQTAASEDASRPGGRTYSFRGHCGGLLAGLDSLRRRRLLFDATLVVGGVEYGVHRAVLAACSDYFRALFTGAMKEQWQTRVVLNGVTPVGIEHLLDYAYSGKLTLDLATVQDVLCAANHLSVVPVVRACDHFLRQQVDLENCVDVLNLAETFSLGRLAATVYRFVGQQMAPLSAHASFQRLSATQLRHVLRGDATVGCRESAVLVALLSWIIHDAKRRLAEAGALLGCVQYPYVSWRDFVAVRHGAVFRAARRRAPRLCHAVRAAMRAARPALPPGLRNPRGYTAAVVSVGGFTPAGLTNGVSALAGGRWRALTRVPHVEQCDFGAAVVDNVLYVAGGCFNEALAEQVHPFVFRYDAAAARWDCAPPLLAERCRFHLAAVPPYLIAVGGDGLLTAHNVERYDTRAACWCQVAPLAVNVSQAAGAVVGRHVYVSGGLDASEVPTDAVSCYDVDGDAWRAVAPLRVARADHGMAAVGGCLYVAGGWLDGPEGRVIVPSLDRYDPGTAQWTELSRVPTPRYHASVVVSRDHVYVIGGLSGNGGWGGRGGSRAVQTYGVADGAWTDAPDCPTELWEHLACVLHIPICNENDDGDDTELFNVE